MTTGSRAVSGVLRMARHTSYPLISGITTSRSTMSGGSAATFSSASLPEDAVLTA